MLNPILCEFKKLKHYSILWAGILAVLFSVGYAVFQMALGGRQGASISFSIFYFCVVFNNFALIFPAVSVLIGGFLINREYNDNTLKSILTVPVAMRKLLAAKLITTGIIVLLLSLLSFAATMLSAAVLLHAPDITPAATWKAFIQICGVAFMNYLAVMPLIAWFSRKPNQFMAGVGVAFVYGFCGNFAAARSIANFYPITAGFGIVGYQSGEYFNPVIGCVVLALMVALTAGILYFPPIYDAVSARPKKRTRSAKSGS